MAQSLSEGVLFGMGNPLLDISAVVDKSFLDKYVLKENDAILATEEHKHMYKHIVDTYKDIEYIAGGSTQNSLRVAQWILGIPNLTTYMGAVGKDDYAKQLRDKAEEAGVKVRYQELDKYPTGTCAVLLTGTNRSLCAYLGAADHFNIKHFDSDDNWSYVEKALFYYISGFFLTVSPDSIKKVATYASSHDRPLLFNLSAPFVSQFFVDRVDDVIPYVDVLFGNEDEAQAFSNSHLFGTKDLVEIAKKICVLPKNNSKRPRVVIFTQGKDPVIVVTETSVQEFPIVPIAKEDIVDTNGAGDAFAGGFLAQYVQGKDMAECVKCAIWAASVIIQRSGCTFPTEMQYKE